MEYSHQLLIHRQCVNLGHCGIHWFKCNQPPHAQRLCRKLCIGVLNSFPLVRYVAPQNPTCKHWIQQNSTLKNVERYVCTYTVRKIETLKVLICTVTDAVYLYSQVLARPTSVQNSSLCGILLFVHIHCDDSIYIKSVRAQN